MTLDEQIHAAEGDAIQRLSDTVGAAIVAATSWFLTPFGAIILKFLVMPAVNWVIKNAVKQLDLGAYYIYKASKNPADAEKYEDSVKETKAANESGNRDAIRKAEMEQKCRFAIALGLSS